MPLAVSLPKQKRGNNFNSKVHFLKGRGLNAECHSNHSIEILQTCQYWKVCSVLRILSKIKLIVSNSDNKF